MQTIAFNTTETMARLSLLNNIPMRSNDEYLRLLLSHMENTKTTKFQNGRAPIQTTIYDSLVLLY